MTDPLQASFWDDEYWAMYNSVAPNALNVLFAGGQQGSNALPKGLQVLVNWDWFNQAAVDWLNTWAASDTALMGIHGTTRTQAIKAIQDWVRSGEHLDVLKKKLTPLFGKSRAERIAVTEVTRMYSEGNRLAWKSTGFVTGRKWQTAQDEKVCPICGPLHGMVSGIDENGFTTELGGLGLVGPPAHIRCRCWTVPVVTEQGLRDVLLKQLGKRR